MADLATCIGDILELEARRFCYVDQIADAGSAPAKGERGSGRPGRAANVVLAVSGGADSLALILAASAYCRSHAGAPHFHVVTVDHRLRDASAAEARHVEACAELFGLTSETCRWTDAPLATGNIAAAARQARYRFLGEAAARCGARLILAAHHEDDQIETHLMAAARGAGPFGLAGMRSLTEMSPRLRLGRPFLALPAARLKASVAAAGLAAVDDPTNRDLKSERVRLRLALRSGELSRSRYVEALAVCRAARMRGEAKLAGAMSHLEASGALRFADDATAVLSRNGLRELEHDVAFHLLRRLLTAVGGAASAPSGEAVARLLHRIGTDTAPGFAATLGGTRLRLSCEESAGTMLLCREYGRTGPPGVDVATSIDRPMLFDRRFDVTLPCGRSPPGARLVPFAHFGRGNLVERTLPVLVSRDTILAAPAQLARHVAPGTPQLGLDSRVRWRAMADLTGTDGISLASAEPPFGSGLPSRG